MVSEIIGILEGSTTGKKADQDYWELKFDNTHNEIYNVRKLLGLDVYNSGI